MDYVVLFNPIAGRGRAALIAEAVGERIRSAGHGARLVRSERAGHIEELSAQVEAERVLVLGGDGSLREAAAGWLRRAEPFEQRPELGVLPFGSGNVVARELGLSLDPTIAIDEIMGFGALDFDVGLAAADGGKPEVFLAMLGIGFDASIARRIGLSRKTRLGGAVYRRSADVLYAKEAVRQLFSFRAPRFSVEVDGVSFEGAARAAVISNAETYAKGMAMSPGASPVDGELALHVRRSAAFWTGVIAMAAAQLRREGPGWVTRRCGGREIKIGVHGAEPLCWQLDGDPMEDARTIEVSVVPGGIRLIGKLA